ncbi:unnamed protein product [Caenorhabditis nigoni]
MVVTVTALKLFTEFFFIGFLVGLTCINIKQQNKKTTLSHCTMTLQRKFYMSIIIQTVIPFCVILLPLGYCAYSVAEQYYNQAMNNISFLIIASHGLISTIAMMLIHKPYRETTFVCWSERKPRRISIISSIHIFHE